MPTRRQDDRSPGDAREPYSDIGGPDARHAQTHDVRREQLTNPRGPDTADESFAADLAPAERPGDLGGHEEESLPAQEDKRLQTRLQSLSADELSRLSVLAPGARLEQGGVYLDLNDLERGPFRAIGGQEARADNRYVAKRDTDYELWNRLAGDDADPRIERPVDS